MENIDSPETFDREYVKSLRQEAARYRTEAKELKSELESYRMLEAQINTVRVEAELTKRNVIADPSWIQLAEGQNPVEAVDNFLEKYPQFKTGQIESSIEDKESKSSKDVPKIISPNSNKASNPSSVPAGTLGNRDLKQIKDDPIARTNLRDLYRDLLNSSSNQIN